MNIQYRTIWFHHFVAHMLQHLLHLVCTQISHRSQQIALWFFTTFYANFTKKYWHSLYFIQLLLLDYFSCFYFFIIYLYIYTYDIYIHEEKKKEWENWYLCLIRILKYYILIPDYLFFKSTCWISEFKVCLNLLTFVCFLVSLIVCLVNQENFISYYHSTVQHPKNHYPKRPRLYTSDPQKVRIYCQF